MAYNNPTVEEKPGHSYCFIHERHEPVPSSFFEVCFECGHVYRTAEELREAYQERCKQHGKTPKRAWLFNPKFISFCQECLHDFA